MCVFLTIVKVGTVKFIFVALAVAAVVVVAVAVVVVVVAVAAAAAAAVVVVVVAVVAVLALAVVVGTMFRKFIVEPIRCSNHPKPTQKSTSIHQTCLWCHHVPRDVCRGVLENEVLASHPPR